MSKVYKLDRQERDAINYYVNETLMFLFEHNVLMELRR